MWSFKPAYRRLPTSIAPMVISEKMTHEKTALDRIRRRAPAASRTLSSSCARRMIRRRIPSTLSSRIIGLKVDLKAGIGLTIEWYQEEGLL